MKIKDLGNGKYKVEGVGLVKDEDLREMGICPSCLQELEPIYENNGFQPPDPTHYEIVGYKPCECERSDKE